MFGDWFSTIKINLFGHKQSCICLQYVFVVMEKMNNFSQAAKWQILLFYNFPKIHSISYFIQNIVQKKNISFCSLQTIPSLNEKTHLRRYTSLEYNFFLSLKRHYLGYPKHVETSSITKNIFSKQIQKYWFRCLANSNMFKLKINVARHACFKNVLNSFVH